MLHTLSKISFLNKMFEIKIYFLPVICFLVLSAFMQNSSQAQINAAGDSKATLQKSEREVVNKKEEELKKETMFSLIVDDKMIREAGKRKEDLDKKEKEADSKDKNELTNVDRATSLKRSITAIPVQSLVLGQGNAQIGTVINTQKISNDIDAAGDPFVGQLDIGDLLGSSVSAGDSDNDGITDFFYAGAFGTDGEGAAFIFFLDSEGRVDSVQNISNPNLIDPDDDEFGHGGTVVGDIDNDGNLDLAIGAPGDNAAWILFLNANGTVKANPAPVKLGDGLGNFPAGLIGPSDEWAHTVSNIGDLDNDGTPDIIVSSPGDDNDPNGVLNLDGDDTGSACVIFLNPDGTVKAHQKITDANLGGGLEKNDRFGGAGGYSIGDLDGNGVQDAAIGGSAIFNDDGTLSASIFGSVWVLFLNTDGTVDHFQEISDNVGGFGGTISADGAFGHGVSGAIGDLDGDGVTEIAVGDFLGFDNVPVRTGASWILFLNTDGTVKAEQKISNNEGGFAGDLDGNDWFGFNVAAIGDINGDNVPDFTAGAIRDDGDDTGAANDDIGAIWVLNLSGFAEVNQFFSGVADPSTFLFDPAPVPEGPAGTFSFSLDFCNTSSDTIIVDSKSITAILTNGNALISRDPGTPAGVGSEQTFPATGGNDDLKLEAGECVRVDYKIGLAVRASFQFFVDVFGVVE